jgi:curved DNA-binding protein CbpA
MSQSKRYERNYYDLLGVHPSASPIEIRRAYRELSKKYHPDTTTLPMAIATANFQVLNEAYAVASNPERRLAYDKEIGYSRLLLVQPPAHFQPIAPREDNYRSSAYLDPTDRPLSGGEIFAIFMLLVTFFSCLGLAIAIGLARGEIVWG